MIRKINNYWGTEEERQILRTKGYTVVGIADEIKQQINDMAQTCMATPNCVGLAANQIWEDTIMPPPAIFVLRMKEGVIPFINPVLDKAFKKETNLGEQCMSVPGKKVWIRRPYHIAVRFLDGEGNERSQHLYDVMARMWMHEYDHVIGKVIVDYE